MFNLLTAMLSSTQQTAQESLSAATATAENETVAVTITGSGQVLSIIIKDDEHTTPILQEALVDAVNSAILMSQQLARAAQLEALQLFALDDDDESDESDEDDDAANDWDSDEEQ